MRRRTVRPLDVSPRALAIALIVLAAATELKFRQRDATAALEAGIDAQIILELGVWGSVFGWLVVLALRRRRRILQPFLPIGLHPTLRILSVIGVAAVIWSFMAPTTLSVVRAFQFAAMTA